MARLIIYRKDLFRGIIYESEFVPRVGDEIVVLDSKKPLKVRKVEHFFMKNKLNFVHIHVN